MNADASLPSQVQTGWAPPTLKPISLGWRSRIMIWVMRWILRPWVAWLVRGSSVRIARVQLMLSRRLCRDSSGLPLDYRVVGRVPGHVLGDLADTHRTAILYLHGGAFLLPAVPEVHVHMVSRLCRELDAVGFVPDYRLSPFNKFPAALDDCERAYRALLDLGFAPQRIVIAGESAGGTLTLGVLQRIRKHGWPMPACALPISPGTELGRIHAPPARALKMKNDPILPLSALVRVDGFYGGGWDTSDPEFSPLYMDCHGLPPLYFLTTDNEVVMDDAILLARRAHEQGVNVRLDVWQKLPHAFPLFGRFFPEARASLVDMAAFMREHVDPE